MRRKGDGFCRYVLAVEELAEVITIDFLSDNIPTYNPDLRCFTPKDILDFCAGFVTFVPLSEGNYSLSI